MGGLFRYPGAQPFSDEAVSRSVFFGRQKESTTLTDEILAHRLVVVYAKSGLGKTSLLQAGVAQPLRDDGYLPLFVRVNDVKQGPLVGVLDGVGHSAARQNVEYIAGSELSLWHFFKTAEFWHADRMLTPVLVLDQFEELFTLHASEARATILRELGHLVRGVRPEPAAMSPRVEPALTDAPPAIRIVISLREDYLGALEEAADSIPQILDHRFRISPLTVEAAVAALEGPAGVGDERFATEPFTYGPGTVESVLAYLSQRAKDSAVRPGRFVEPFHLQLICQRVETLVAVRQRLGARQVEIGLDDLGGERGLNATLRDFYKNLISRVNPPRTRKKVRRLCEQYLISPEGRRLSLEGGEIKRILKLKPGTLKELVNGRLLRSDQRADNWYYELSHDSLVAPILATRKTQGIAIGALGLVGSLFVGLIGIGLLFTAPVLVFFAISESSSSPLPKEALAVFFIGSAIILAASPLFLWISGAGVRRSVETLNRYTSPPS